MEIVKKISIVLGVLLVLGSIAAALIQYGQDKESINSRAFESPAQMVKTVTYVQQAPSPAAMVRTRILDSIKNETIIQSTKFRDSIMIIERKARMHTDSMNQLNADQFYQNKKIQEIILQKLNKLERQQ